MIEIILHDGERQLARHTSHSIARFAGVEQESAERLLRELARRNLLFGNLRERKVPSG